MNLTPASSATSRRKTALPQKVRDRAKNLLFTIAVASSFLFLVQVLVTSYPPTAPASQLMNSVVLPGFFGGVVVFGIIMIGLETIIFLRALAEWRLSTPLTVENQGDKLRRQLDLRLWEGRFSEGILPEVVRALTYTWSETDQPSLVLVLGAHFTGRYPVTGPCGLDHPLTAQSLADADDRFEEEFSHLGRKIPVLFNPDLAHSVIRWIDPDGDRAIVVLPPAADK